MSDWKKPKYPGDAVRIHMLQRNDPRFGPEIGDVRIQYYGTRANSEPDPSDKVRVATFLPGVVVSNPGDTPKMEPEFNNWYAASNVATANEAFDEYVRCAREGGWQDYNPNGSSR